MGSPRDDLVAGARDVLPITIGNVAFGTVVGVAAVDVGLSELQAVAMSLIVFAGS